MSFIRGDFGRSGRSGRAGQRWVAVVALFGLSSGCAAAPAPRPTLPDPNAPLEQREHAYEAAHLHADGNWFSGYDFERSDGSYRYDQIKPLLDLSPETQAVADDVTTTVWVTVVPAAIGGALVGLALADDLGGQKMSAGTTASFYVTGGVLVVGAIIAAAILDPEADVEAAYNKALRERLALEKKPLFPPPP